jgi:hypothetical protein
MGRKTYDSEVWDKYVPEFMQGNLNRENEIQKSNIDASARIGVADRSAAASRYHSDQYLKAAQERGEQTGQPVDYTPDAIKYGQEAYKTMIGQGFTTEEAQDAQRKAEFEYKAKMNQGQLFRNKKDGTEAWVMPDGAAYDSYGYPIEAGPQASVAPQTTNRVAQNQPRQIKSWMNDWDWDRPDLRNRTV